MLEHIQRLPIEVIQVFLKNRDAKKTGVPGAVGDYILQINDAYNLNKKYRSVSECANKLRLKYPDLSLPTCKKRVYDAISFFNANCDVTAEAWDSYFADRMANLFEINLVARDLKEARRCAEKEREYRLSASQNRVDPRLIQFKPQIVSADVQLERMGVTPKGVLGTFEKAIAIIQSREIAPHEKKRIMIEAGRELNIKDEKGGYAEYEKIED